MATRRSDRYVPVERIEVRLWDHFVGACALDPGLGVYVFAYDGDFAKTTSALYVEYGAARVDPLLQSGVVGRIHVLERHVRLELVQPAGFDTQGFEKFLVQR